VYRRNDEVRNDEPTRIAIAAWRGCRPPIGGCLLAPAAPRFGRCECWRLVRQRGAYPGGRTIWSVSKPIRKVYYNVTITALSVAVALIINTIGFVIVGAIGRHLGDSAGGTADSKRDGRLACT
jgi:hypothetical protein